MSIQILKSLRIIQIVTEVKHFMVGLGVSYNLMVGIICQHLLTRSSPIRDLRGLERANATNLHVQCELPGGLHFFFPERARAGIGWPKEQDAGDQGLGGLPAEDHDNRDSGDSKGE